MCIITLQQTRSTPKLRPGMLNLFTTDVRDITVPIKRYIQLSLEGKEILF